MDKKRVFISFDYDHDRLIRDYVVGQAKNPNSPFEISDASVRNHLSGNWEKKVRNRIRRADLVIVICGEHTHEAEGVAAEVKMAQEEGKPYFLLKGRREGICAKPTTARNDDQIYEWTWDNLRKLIEGRTFTESVEECLDSPAPWIIVGGIGLALLIRSMQERNRVVQTQQIAETSYGQARFGYPPIWDRGYSVNGEKRVYQL